MKRKGLTAILALTFLLGPSLLSAFSSEQPQTPATELPILITSCGQSPGATMLKVIFMRLKLEAEPKAYEVNMLATADDLIKSRDEGTPYKTLIVVMGASLKGMGAAGISIDSELARCAELIEEAKKQEITIIGAHIEGMKRRAQGASAGDNTDEQSIDTVAPHSDLLVVNEDGNKDNRFTIIAEAQSIPLILIQKNLDLLEEFGKLFKN